MNLGVGVNKFTATLCHVPSWWEEHTVAGRARLLLLFISRLSLCKDSRIGVRSPSGGTRGGLYDSGECTPFQGSRQTGTLVSICLPYVDGPTGGLSFHSSTTCFAGAEGVVISI